MQNEPWTINQSSDDFLFQFKDRQTVFHGATLILHQRQNAKQKIFMLIAFNKPFGVLSQFSSDGSPNRTLAEFGFPPSVYPVGRLDADSEGLLILSDQPDWNARPSRTSTRTKTGGPLPLPHISVRKMVTLCRPFCACSAILDVIPGLPPARSGSPWWRR